MKSAVKFYETVKNQLNNLVNYYGIENVQRYYDRTDYRDPQIDTLQGIPKIFAQYLLHTQNATMLSSIVKFETKFEFLKHLFCEFNPKDFLIKYNPEDRNNAIHKIVEDLRYNDQNPEGLKWSTEKSSKPDFLITRFANSVLDGALYFSRDDFKNPADVIEDLYKHFSSMESLVKYMKSNFKHGFSIALCCDFAKELDARFDLPKPDVHIMEVLSAYKDYPKDYYKATEKRALECIRDFLEIVDEIKKSYPEANAYMFDKMIWLCCTEDFYMDHTFKNSKSRLISSVSQI